MIARGELQVQDEAAGLVVAVLDPRPGDSILDACAAPGGKTMMCAARMRGEGRILAMDVSAARLRALEATVATQGHGALVSTEAADLREYARRGAAQFDKVLSLDLLLCQLLIH